MKIDLGVPLLSLILIFWSILVMISILNTIFGRENLKEVRDFFRRLLDTHPHKKQKKRPL
jgi:hypothetical protein